MLVGVRGGGGGSDRATRLPSGQGRGGVWRGLREAGGPVWKRKTLNWGGN